MGELLQKSEERLKLAFQVTEEGFWDADLSLNTVFFSDRCRELLSLGDEANSLEEWRRRIHPDDAERVSAYFEDHLNQTLPLYETEYRVAVPDGSVRWLLDRGRVVSRDASGRALRVVGALTEISERKRLEAALVQAMDSIEAANRAKSEFLSSMSHELRTPLNAILGFSQILQENVNGTFTQDDLEFVNHILTAGWHLLDLINDVLDLSKIETGVVQLKMETVPLEELLKKLSALAVTLAEKRGIQVAFPPDETDWCVRADRIRLHQVLLNLISNAIKYNVDQGQLEVRIEKRGEDRIRVSVRDTGRGLNEEQLGQLFQPFNRLGAENSSVEGTGIGLVISKKLLELMGGAIGVVSETGKGSTFWVELDSARRFEASAGVFSGAKAGLESGLSFPDGKKRQILYVEDNPANLKVVVALLRRFPQIEVLSSMSAVVALDRIRTNPPDLILMDIGFSGMSGEDAVKILKADPETRSIPVVALSARAMAADIESGINAGFDRYLTKPIKSGELYATLAELLK